MKLFFPFLIISLSICSKDCVGMNLDFIPEDVRHTIDEQIITPARNTFLGAIARKIGVIDFFVNLIRGTKRTFFGGSRKERRKPRNGFLQHTTKKYEPILYQDTRTASPLQISTLNGNGIYMMTAPALGPQVEILRDQVTEGPFESSEIDTLSVPQNSISNPPEVITMQSILQKLRSNPIHVSPISKPEIFPIRNANENRGNEVSSNLFTSNKSPSDFPNFSFIQNEMKKVASLPQMFENVERVRSPFHLYQMSNYTIRSQNDYLHIVNDRRANFTRIPRQDASLSSLEDLISTPSQLSTSIIKQIKFRRLNDKKSKTGNNESLNMVQKSQNQGNANLDQLQVFTRTDPNVALALNDNKEGAMNGVRNSFTNAKINQRKMVDIEGSINEELKSKNVSSHAIERMDNVNCNEPTKLVNKNDSRNNLEENSADKPKNVSIMPMKKANNTSKQNTSINDLIVNADKVTSTNNTNHTNDDIIHRFQFFYLPKRNAYGFSSDRIKELTRKLRKSNFSKLKRKKRKNARKRKKVDGAIENSIGRRNKDFVFQNEYNSDMIHEVQVFSTESPFPSLYLKYKFHDLSNV